MKLLNYSHFIKDKAIPLCLFYFCKSFKYKKYQFHVQFD